MANQFTDSRVKHLDVGNVCGVYLIIDTVTGATYVGAAVAIRRRISGHFVDMQRHPDGGAYKVFGKTFAEHGASAFEVQVMQRCTRNELKAAEVAWIARLNPSENMQECVDGRRGCSDVAVGVKSAAAARLWADPTYRERAVAARIGKAYNKGYKCTPEQVANRRKAGRISNMKRAYGADWASEYVRRYPEFAGDVYA